MSDLLSEDEVLAALAEIEGRAGAAVPAQPRGLYRPLIDAAEEYEAWARNPQERIYTGISALDQAMRGTAPGELTVIGGFAHSGKTLIATEILLNNQHKRIAYFTPDETRSLILVKLCCSIHNITARALEWGLENNDQRYREMLRETATRFPTLAVFDEGVNLDRMTRGLSELQDVWGEPIDAVIFDYLDLLGDFEDTRSCASALKAWGKNHHVPLFVLHQSSRTAGKDGAKFTMTSVGYGGEQQATHLIGVRRKRDEISQQIDELEQKLRSHTTTPDKAEIYREKLREQLYDLGIHKYTLTVNLVKNKRPPCDRVDDLDFELDANTGKLWPLGPGELPRQYLREARSQPTAAVRARAEQMEMEPF